MNEIDRKIAELKQVDKNFEEWAKNGFKKDLPQIMIPESDCKHKVPDNCYKDFGSDLDGCSRQENQGCKGCICLIDIAEYEDYLQ